MANDRNNKGRNNGSTISDRWDIWKIGNGGSSRASSTFFFTDFAESWGAKDLYFEFKELGEIDEIVIHAKRDWREKVWFCKVQ